MLSQTPELSETRTVNTSRERHFEMVVSPNAKIWLNTLSHFT